MFVLSEIARKSYAQFRLDFETFVTGNESKTEVTSHQPPEPGALPSTLDHLAAKYRPFIERVMARLSEAERHEVNLHYQADYRQSWICLSFANKGLADPFVSASYQMYGIHPSKVWERIVEDRKARLGNEYYDWYDSADMPRPDVPKIPPVHDVQVSGRTAVGLADSGSQANTQLEPEVRTGVFVSLPDSTSAAAAPMRSSKAAESGADTVTPAPLPTSERKQA